MLHQQQEPHSSNISGSNNNRNINDNNNRNNDNNRNDIINTGSSNNNSGLIPCAGGASRWKARRLCVLHRKTWIQPLNIQHKYGI